MLCKTCNQNHPPPMCGPQGPPLHRRTSPSGHVDATRPQKGEEYMSVSLKSTRCSPPRRGTKNAPIGLKKVSAARTRALAKYGTSIPKTCHVFHSKNPSSLRTVAAAVSNSVAKAKLRSKQRHKQQRRANRKILKLAEETPVCPVPPNLATFTNSMLASAHPLVFDGGMFPSIHPIKPPPGTDWTRLVVLNDLYPLHSKSLKKGYSYPNPSGGVPPIIVPPREACLQMTNLLSQESSDLLVKALQSAINTKHGTYRGNSKAIYGSKDVVFMGVKASMNSKGCVAQSYHQKSMPPQEWDVIFNYVKNLERVFRGYIPPNVELEHRQAKNLVPFPTMANSNGSEYTNIFPSVAIGCNAFLPCHIDDDFTMSICVVHKLSCQYQHWYFPLVYFCFPRLGVAVALRPGEVLIFNPREPHAISSRTIPNTQVYTMVAYLKTSIVGGNDNSVDLTKEQMEVLKLAESKHN